MAFLFRRYEWVLPMLLAALAVARLPVFSPVAMSALLCWVPGRLILRATGIGREWNTLARVVLAFALSIAATPVFLNVLWHKTNDPHGLLLPVWLGLTVLALLVHWLCPAEDGEVAVAQPRATGNSGNSLDCGAAASTENVAPGDPLATVALGGATATAHHGVALGGATATRMLPGKNRLFGSRNSRIAIVVLTALIAWYCIAPYWPRESHGAPVPSAIHDYIKHYAVMWSLQEHPLPLGNPFFADGAREPAYYYHFFYLIPATIRAVCDGPSIPLAFGLHGAFIAVTTAGLAALLARRLFGSDRCALLAFALCTVVGGFDIIPILLLRSPAITLDAWADTLVRIHNLLTQMVWTPQNVQGLAILLLAAFVLTEKGYWRGWFLLGPLLAVSLIGSTVWVAVVAFPALALLIATDVFFRRGPGLSRLRLFCTAAFVGFLMICASSPIWIRYQDVARSHGKSLTLDWPERQEHAILGRFLPPGVLANLADLPWVLLLEMGPLLILPLMLPLAAWRRAWNDTGMRLLMLSAIVALVGFVSVRSSFTYNDFGQKVVMSVLVCGAILGAGVLAKVSQSEPDAPARGKSEPDAQARVLGEALPKTTSLARRARIGATSRWFVAAVLLLGLPVSAWQSPLAAIRRFVTPNGPLGRISLALDSDDALAVQYLRDLSPANAVVQGHWNGERVDPRQPDRLTLQQMIGRQIGAMVLEQDTHVFQGRDPSLQSQAVNEVSAVLTGDAPAVECHAVLRRHGITHLFVGSIERACWRDLQRFEEAVFFRCEFRQGGAAVYELR